jgi:DNA primase
VYTAFDGDMAGRIATARWREALDEGSFVSAVPIPDGEDVLSSGIPVIDLLKEAE